MDILQNVMDSSSHAMFTMDRQGIVTHINQQAKERFGLFNHSLYAHSAGRLEPGDLVILATTAMGADDGNLTPEDLAVIGIRDPRLRPNDILAAVGVYKGPGVKPVYKYLRGGESVGLHLDVTFQGVPISVHIGDKQVAVEVREKVYSITYFVSICQAVILDHRTRQVKFWEEKGYSARKEGLGSLLRGGTYIAKSPDQEICVVGYHFKDFFEGELFEEHLRQVLDGQAPGFSDVAYEINGFARLASILPIRDGEEIAGIIVKFRNIEDIRTTIMERNTAIAAAERKYRESHLVTVPLAQFAVADRLEKKREVGESRPRILPAEGLVKKIMEREGRKPFFAADNLGDLHQMVIHDVCEMIGRKFVGLLPENLVIKCVGVDLDVSADEVIHPDDCVLRHLETDCPAVGLTEQPLSLFLRKGK